MLGNVLSNILLIASPVLLATGAIRITNPMNVIIEIIIVLFRFNSPTIVTKGKHCAYQEDNLYYPPALVNNTQKLSSVARASRLLELLSNH